MIDGGYGAMTWPNGDKYQGYWTAEGRMDGNGAYTFADGSKSPGKRG